MTGSPTRNKQELGAIIRRKRRTGSEQVSVNFSINERLLLQIWAHGHRCDFMQDPLLFKGDLFRNNEIINASCYFSSHHVY